LLLSDGDHHVYVSLNLKQASAEWISRRLTAGFGTRRAVAAAHVEPVNMFALSLLYWLAFLAS